MNETIKLDATASALNEARISVVDFLDEVEACQRLNIASAVVMLRRAIKQYTTAIKLIEESGIDSIISGYYQTATIDAAVEKRLVSAMFQATIKQDIPRFNRYYQAYVRKLGGLI